MIMKSDILKVLALIFLFDSFKLSHGQTTTSTTTDYTWLIILVSVIFGVIFIAFAVSVIALLVYYCWAKKKEKEALDLIKEEEKDEEKGEKSEKRDKSQNEVKKPRTNTPKKIIIIEKTPTELNLEDQSGVLQLDNIIPVVPAVHGSAPVKKAYDYQVFRVDSDLSRTKEKKKLIFYSKQNRVANSNIEIRREVYKTPDLSVFALN